MSKRHLACIVIFYLTEAGGNMAENRVNRENYLVIQGFMIRDLKLKGNELLIYAIIYGFSQAENQVFSGSLQYLADWTNSTKQGVIKNLKSLTEKGFIVKQEKTINGVKFCEYYSTKLNTLLNKVEYPIEQSLTGDIKQSLNNNIYNNTDYNINNNIDYIISYLNQKAKTSYRANTKDTVKHIKARLKEGYTIEDFKIVIDKQCNKWIGTQFQDYLRPATLFGTKFESYLNSKANNNTYQQQQGTGNIFIDMLNERQGMQYDN